MPEAPPSAPGISRRVDFDVPSCDIGRKALNLRAIMIERLKKAVELRFGKTIGSPADFDELSMDIALAGGKSISPTTLKRIWNYISDCGDAYRPSLYSLSTLASYAGFKDYDDFKQSRDDAGSQSWLYFGETLLSRDIPGGAVIELYWYRGRHVTLRCTSEGQFEVLKSVNSKLREGDLLECTSFTRKAPLYVNRLLRLGQPATTYVAGARFGISFSVCKK